MTHIEIYPSIGITPDKNYLIENIEAYLNGKQHESYDNFNYVKHDLNIELKIPRDKLANERYDNSYAAITNEGSPRKTFYYFIVATRILSDGAVALSLVMDTVNTFQNELIFTNKTHITRQHKDRFLNVGYKEDAFNGLRIIDPMPEGLNPTLKLHTVRDIIQDSELDTSWYLIYRTPIDIATNQKAPLECLMCADIALKLEEGTRGPVKRLKPQYKKTYYFTNADNPGGNIMDRGIYGLGDVYPGKGTIEAFIINADFEQTFKFITIYKDSKGEIHSTENTESQDKYPNGFNLNNIRLIRIVNSTVSYDLDVMQTFSAKTVNSGITEAIETVPFEKFDRTDSRLVKIFKLPYCPVYVSVSPRDKTISFPGTDWTVSGGLIKLKYDAQLENDLGQKTNVTKWLKTTIPSDYIGNKRKDVARSVKYESKIFNSEYFTYKLQYADTFITLPLENFRPNIDFIEPTLTFKTTNTVNSNFGIKVDVDSQSYTYKHKDLYDNYLFVNRNNEETIYNNAFIDYVNSGNYNTDRTNFGLSSAARWTGLLTGLAGTGISAGLGYSLGTSGVRGWTLASAGLGAASSFIGGILGQIQAQNELDQKQRDLAYQATSVRGSTDIDLMTWYSGNKLKEITEHPDTHLWHHIWDLFFYCGYKDDTFAIPDLHSRYYFNFIECSPDWSETMKVKPEYKDDLSARFEKGITIFHYHNDDGWDLTQKKENWEAWMIR